MIVSIQGWMFCLGFLMLYYEQPLNLTQVKVNHFGISNIYALCRSILSKAGFFVKLYPIMYFSLSRLAFPCVCFHDLMFTAGSDYSLPGYLLVFIITLWTSFFSLPTEWCLISLFYFTRMILLQFHHVLKRVFFNYSLIINSGLSFWAERIWYFAWTFARVQFLHLKNGLAWLWFDI
jgi:hypothetical protein